VTDVPLTEHGQHPWLRHLADLERPPMLVDIIPSGADRPDLWSWSIRGDMTAAAAGLMALTGHPDQEPLQPEFPLAEYLGGTLAALRIVAELRRARLAGTRPADIETVLHQALLRMIEWQLPVATATGKPELRMGNAFPMNSGISNMHLTRDGKYFAVSAANQAAAVKLMTLIGGAALACDPRFATVEARSQDIAPLYALMDAWFAARTSQEVLHAAQTHDVVVGPVLDPDSILANEHIRERANIITTRASDGTSVHMPNIVPRISGIVTAIRNMGPPLGQDNAEIIASLGAGAS
jgi:crotonobetainyl-CoA:carnitine CoA-transferase CaiB-like acyl-CoA transferase